MSYLSGKDSNVEIHVSKTSGTGAAGTVDTYTLWGDLAGTVPLGNFTVLNGSAGGGSSTLDIAGTTMVFYQATAPVGWTRIVDPLLDLAGLRLVTSTTMITGVTGTVDPFAPHTHANSSDGLHAHTINQAGSHTHNTLGHTLTTGEIPLHSHTYSDHTPTASTFAVASGTGATVGNPGELVFTRSTGNSGSGGSHNHGATAAGGLHIHTAQNAGTHTHTISANTASKYVNIIMAVKN